MLLEEGPPFTRRRTTAPRDAERIILKNNDRAFTITFQSRQETRSKCLITLCSVRYASDTERRGNFYRLGLGICWLIWLVCSGLGRSLDEIRVLALLCGPSF